MKSVLLPLVLVLSPALAGCLTSTEGSISPWKAQQEAELVGGFAGRSSFEHGIRAMSDEELWALAILRSDAISERMRLTGELRFCRWNDTFTDECTSREEELLVSVPELASFSKPELEERILATEGVPFSARLLQQLQRAHGSTRGAIKLERERLDSIAVANLTEELANRLRAREVWIGMSADHLLMSLGKPKDINSTVRKGGRSDQWVYGGGRYAYLENNVLTAVQL